MNSPHLLKTHPPKGTALSPTPFLGASSGETASCSRKGCWRRPHTHTSFVTNQHATVLSWKSPLVFLKNLLVSPKGPDPPFPSPIQMVFNPDF